MRARIDLLNYVGGYSLGTLILNLAVAPAEDTILRIDIGSQFDGSWKVFRVAHRVTGNSTEHDHELEIEVFRN